MDKYLKRIFLYIALAILCGILCSLVAHCVRRHLEQSNEPLDVTEVVRTDTTYIDKPIVVTDTLIKYVYVKVPTTQQSDKEMYVPPNPKIEKTQETQTNPDKPKKPSGFSCDSVEVLLPITQKEYCDTNYRAWVSGYLANLDSIRIYNRTIERTYAPKRSRLHLTIGAGAAFNGRFEPAIFVGVGWSFCEIKF